MAFAHDTYVGSMMKLTSRCLALRLRYLNALLVVTRCKKTDALRRQQSLVLYLKISCFTLLYQLYHHFLIIKKVEFVTFLWCSTVFPKFESNPAIGIQIHILPKSMLQET